MKKTLLLYGLLMLSSLFTNAQQVIWDTIISFGPNKDVPASLIGDDANIFYIAGYTKNSGNASTDPFLIHMDLTTFPTTIEDSIYHTPSNFEKIYDAYYDMMGDIEIVGSDSVSGTDRNSFDLIYSPGNGFNGSDTFDLSPGYTDEFICIGSSGSQAKSFGTAVFGYGINNLYYNETNYIDDNQPVLIPNNSNRYYFSAGGDNYMMQGFAVGFSDSSGVMDPLILSNQFGMITTKTIHLPGNQELYSFCSREDGMNEYGTGYSDLLGTKNAFLMSFDPNTVDTLWTKTYNNPNADEVVYASLIHDTTLYLIGNTTIGNETDIFVKQINAVSGILYYEYTLGEPGVKDSVVSAAPNNGCEFALLTAQGNHIHLYKLPYNSFKPNVQDISCYGGNNGSISATPSSTYSYSLTYFDSVLNPITPSNLYIGKYFIQYFDSLNSCLVTDSVIVHQPDSLVVTPLVTNPTCQGLCDGSINLIVIGGTPPYNYIWTNGDTVQNETNLCVNNYGYTITDTNSCYAYGDSTLTAPPPATLTGYLSLPSYGPVDVGDALIYLYKDTSFAGSAYQIAAFDSTVVMFNGEFTFNTLYNADYYLKAKIISQETIYDYAVNTYYDTVINWFDATAMNIQCGTDDTIQMQMYELPITAGTGSISGQIYMSGAKAQGEPVSGAEVFAEQEPDDHPIANTPTDTAGNYNMGGLPLGSTYRLTVDIPGLPLMSTYTGIGISAGNDTVSNLNFIVDTTSGGGIYTDTVTKFMLQNNQYLEYLSIFPNPSSDIVNISYNCSKSEQIKIEVIDISGKIIYSDKFLAKIGDNLKVIDLNKYASNGNTFFLKLSHGNNIYVKKIIRK